jgi:hypothetical protein
MSADNLRLKDLNALLNNLKVRADVQYCSLIVSIDLGTTYSGYVHSFLKCHDNLRDCDYSC